LETQTQSEISGLRQEVADLDAQVKHQTLVSMAANDKVQTLQSELMDAQKKILAASTDRDEAIRKISELQAGLQESTKDLNAVCRALRSGIAELRGRAPAAALALCGAPTPK
jgi:chromosome segregation ATPase